MTPIFRRLFPRPPQPAKRTSNVLRPPPAAAAAPAVTPVRHYFEALNTVDHRTPIPATGLYVHRLLSKFNRLQLASVARYLWDNVGLVFYATDLVANYSTPMVPRAATLDRQWNEAANSFFDEWAERADFTGRFDSWDLQRLGSFYLETDGEVFAQHPLHGPVTKVSKTVNREPYTVEEQRRSPRPAETTITSGRSSSWDSIPP